MSEHVQSHNHKSSEYRDVALLDPSDCTHFLENAHIHEDEDHHAHNHEEHDHDHSHVSKVTWRLIAMIILTGIMFLAELITGFVTSSLSLQSDAFHMLSDEASLIIGLICHKISKRKPSNEMTFGYARAEVLGGLVNATFLLGICLTMFFEGIERLVETEPIKQPKAFLIVGSLGLLVNVLGLFIFHDHSHSDNLQGVFLHVMGDFFGSVAVVVSACVVQFSDWKYKDYLDPILSLIIVLILVMSTQKLFRKTASQVLEKTPDNISVDNLKEEIMKVDGIMSIHELHIWALAKDLNIALAHIVVDSKDKNKRVHEQVTNVLMSFGIFSSTIQIEFVDDFPHEVDHNDSCFYASSYGLEKRAFLTKPVYQHSIGCPHINILGVENQDNHNDAHEHDQYDDSVNANSIA